VTPAGGGDQVPRSRGSAGRADARVADAVQAGVDLLLSVDPATAMYPMGWGNVKPNGSWFRLGFPSGYVSDVLQVIEAVCEAGAAGDPRMASAVEWLVAQWVLTAVRQPLRLRGEDGRRRRRAGDLAVGDPPRLAVLSVCATRPRPWLAAEDRGAVHVSGPDAMSRLGLPVATGPAVIGLLWICGRGSRPTSRWVWWIALTALLESDDDPKSPRRTGRCRPGTRAPRPIPT
jgi:hypothetical protein